MNRFRVTLMSLLMFLSLALSVQPAVADTLAFTGVGGNNSGGVYTYPYNFTVNGTQNVPLMCDTFTNEIYQGETWSAYVSPITGVTTATHLGLFAGESDSAILYDAAGLIYLGALGVGPLASTYSGANLSSGLANWAIWNLFEPSSVASNPYGSGQPSSTFLNSLDSTAIADVSTVQGYAANISLLNADDVVVYTPQTGTQVPSIDGTPQEFIGRVPEPGITALLGFGLTSLWALRRRIAL